MIVSLLFFIWYDLKFTDLPIVIRPDFLNKNVLIMVGLSGLIDETVLLGSIAIESGKAGFKRKLLVCSNRMESVLFFTVAFKIYSPVSWADFKYVYAESPSNAISVAKRVPLLVEKTTFKSGLAWTFFVTPQRISDVPSAETFVVSRIKEKL